MNTLTQKLQSNLWWLSVMIIALVWRLIVIASGTVTFHSDEAIIGLMARHILQGLPIPIFFYGQAYMGSLDALLVAISFRLFGESVISIRIVQLLLYMGIVATTILLIWRITKQKRMAMLVGLFAALPSPVFTLYTTMTLGGYVETLLFGNLVLLCVYELSTTHLYSKRYWILLGATVGLGWWTNYLIIVYVVPAGAYLLWSLIQKKEFKNWKNLVVPVMLSIIAFFLFSAVWWIYNGSNGWSSLAFLSSGLSASGMGAESSVNERFIAFLVLGLPSVMGIRYSWSNFYWAGVWGVVVVVLYLWLLIMSVRRTGSKLFWFIVFGFTFIFIGSSFGIDSTGRYLLPLAVPFAALAVFGAGTGKQNRFFTVCLGLLIATNVFGTVNAIVNNPPGLTSQFNETTDIPNTHDQALIKFLLENGGKYGYGNYWTTFRINFLSGESVILSPMLPYKSDLSYSISVDRYPLYTEVVNKAEHPVFVTAKLPNLDEAIVQSLNAARITYEQRQIGPYTVFYNLSKKTSPQELGLQTLTEN